MPLESPSPSPQWPSDPASAFLAESARNLARGMGKIEHCLRQLTDVDLSWRPHASHNCIQNILLHLCGNLRQWILHGVGDQPDIRDRPAEFSERGPIPGDRLLAQLRDVVRECQSVLLDFPTSRLLEPRRIQGSQTYLLAAIYETVSHFVGHTHQVVYITRLRLGDRYVFQWQPGTPEEGAPRNGQAAGGSQERQQCRRNGG